MSLHEGIAAAPGGRPEYEREARRVDDIGDVARSLSVWERFNNNAAVRHLVVLIVLGAAWEAYARFLDAPLLFPTLSDTATALWHSIVSGVLPQRVVSSVRILLMAYVTGIVLATIFTAIAVSSRRGTDLLTTLTAMFNPLPAIALLPLALLWFGLGDASLIFVVVHSVLWPVALNTHSGFLSVSETQRMVGRNCGLTGIRYVRMILIPAALPSIVSGMKIGWAFAWRTLIAAELVFGVSSSSGGLGWFIFERRNQLETDYVFAGLLAVILIGLLVESVIFRFIEARTVRRWGMQR